MKLDVATSAVLIGIAARAIRCGLERGHRQDPELGDCPAELLATRASFVTLTSPAAGLRGCRGMLEARRPLATDVWHNARASAFDDPRFPAVTSAEFAQLEVEIAVLGALVPLEAGSEDELCRALVPGVDGVVIGWRGRRATFLPKVWEDLPDPAEFLGRLKLKAGLSAQFWAADLEVQRYRTQNLRGRLVSSEWNRQAVVK